MEADIRLAPVAVEPRREAADGEVLPIRKSARLIVCFARSEAVVSRRHHVRIWKTDYTIDGTPIWVGSATHHLAIEIAKRGHLIDHRIDPDVDAERNFIGVDLAKVLSSADKNITFR